MVGSEFITTILGDAAIIVLITVGSAAVIPTCHELAHYRLTPSRNLNRIVGSAIGLPVLINFCIYRRFHLDHHHYLATPRDPEGAHRIDSIKDYGRLMLWAPLVGFVSQFYNIATFNKLQELGNYDRFTTLINHLALCIWIGLAICLTWLFPAFMSMYYWLPVFVGAFFLDAFLSFPEHVNLGGQTGVRTSRIVETNALVGWLTWNQNLHALHHRHPSVPGWKLPRLYRQHMAAGLLGDYVIERGYLRFHARFLCHAWRASRV